MITDEFYGLYGSTILEKGDHHIRMRIQERLRYCRDSREENYILRDELERMLHENCQVVSQPQIIEKEKIVYRDKPIQKQKKKDAAFKYLFVKNRKKIND